MEAVDDRDGADVEFANGAGRHLADRLLAPRQGWLAFLRPKPRARDVMQAAIGALTDYHRSRTRERFSYESLDALAAQRYENAVGNTIRTISLSRTIGGVPVLAADANEGDAGLTVVDVFSLTAIRSLRRRTGARVPPGFDPGMPGPESADWPAVFKTILPGLGGVDLVDERTAGRGFMTSLLLNLRGHFKAREEESGQAPCAGDFTVNCSDGYALEWFEEFRYAPNVFGDRKSSPVTDYLDCGYYRFQATSGEMCIIDRGRHANTPNRRSTILKDV